MGVRSASEEARHVARRAARRGAAPLACIVVLLSKTSRSFVSSYEAPSTVTETEPDALACSSSDLSADVSRPSRCDVT